MSRVIEEGKDHIFWGECGQKAVQNDEVRGNAEKAEGGASRRGV